MSRKIDARGYVRLTGTRFHPRGWIMEHRWLMEQWLGRSLLSTEAVHHRNGDRSDNRYENLELISPKEHTTLHNHLRFPNVRAGRWSEQHDTCIECGKADKPHAQGGRCFRCYNREYQKRRRHEQGAVPEEVSRAAWAVDMEGNVWMACQDCGRSNARHGSRGLCQACVRWRLRYGEPRTKPPQVRRKRGSLSQS